MIVQVKMKIMKMKNQVMINGNQKVDLQHERNNQLGRSSHLEHFQIQFQSLLDHQLVVNQRKTPMTTTTTNLVRILFSRYYLSFCFLLVSDTELENIRSFNTTNEIDDLSDDRRRSSRATTQRNYAKDDDDDSDEDYFDNGRPPPRRMQYKKRRGSDDSFVDDDDDYEKIAQKRKIVKYGKSLHRSSITSHIRKLVDDDDENENENSTDDKRLLLIFFEKHSIDCLIF